MTRTVDELVRRWRRGEGVGAHIRSFHTLPAREATWAPIPRALHPRVQKTLENRSYSHLYAHQAEALGHALSGQHVVVVTPTASGKSMCYHLPTLDSLARGGAALYLFPTKALAQDQRAELDDLLAKTPGLEGIRAEVYDGDTPKDERRRIRKDPRLILTTPDMLHGAILPHHGAWRSLFERLDVLAIDEAHVYRGVFGAHVANVMRRLRRVAAHHGSRPTFVATSATIANPVELATTLTGERFALVDRNGAPAPERTLCLCDPPVDRRTGRRTSARTIATQAAAEALDASLGAIVFTRSRRSVELLTEQLKEACPAKTRRAIASYRGGYLPERRRAIERGLRAGKTRAVVSTNALELGVDIGDLDVCVLAGYPGSIASAWQQIGRVGRRASGAVSLLIASGDPLDQFVVRHPEYLLERSPEHARIDPDNLRVVAEHLRCATHELPWRERRFGGFTPAETDEILDYLARVTPGMGWRGDTPHWDPGAYPAADVGLRSVSGATYEVYDLATREVVASSGAAAALAELFEGAIYQVAGTSYRVEKLDHAARRALVRRASGATTTSAIRRERLQPVEVHAEGMRRMASVGVGEVLVTTRTIGYVERPRRGGEPLEAKALTQPAHELETHAYWLTLPNVHFRDVAGREPEWLALVDGLARVLEVVASLVLMCDARDIGVCIGSPRSRRWLERAPSGIRLVCDDPDEHDQRAPTLRNPTIFVYDRFPGGAGLAQGLHGAHDEVVSRAFELLSTCPCERGCPSCVGPPTRSGAIKAKARRLLAHLARRAP